MVFKKLAYIFYIILFGIHGLMAQVKISYLGNMGVLISDGENSIVIDGLHDFYKKDYQYPNKKLLNNLIEGKYKDEGALDFHLVTHYHQDHFDKHLSHAFIMKNMHSLMICSEQTKEELDDIPFDNLNNILTVPYDTYRKHEFHYSEVSITALKMNHVNLDYHKAVQNIGYLISIDGKNILHTGDTDWHEGIQLFDKLKLKEASIDIAILPNWMLMKENSDELVKKYIDPKMILVTHVSPFFSESEILNIKKKFSNIVFFRKLEQFYLVKE